MHSSGWRSNVEYFGRSHMLGVNLFYSVRNPEKTLHVLKFWL